MNGKNKDNNQSEMIIYTTEDGLAKIETTFDGDTVWLSIDQMAELFQRDRSVIGKHVRNIFKEGELQKEAVWAKFAHTAADGKVYDVDYYNLDVIISVGYRVKSQRGVQFRIWATEASAISRQLTRQPASTGNTKPVPSVKLSAIIWIPSSCWSRKQIKSKPGWRRRDEKRKDKSLYLMKKEKRKLQVQVGHLHGRNS